jgi:DNA helicase-2/ATP-dependent DNA helicase PcrA
MWSKFQEDIFKFVRSGKGSAVIEAVAGSGKTTTIVEAAKLLPRTGSAAFLAFNKAIATELKKKLPTNVKAMTLNAMGFTTWGKHIGRYPNVDGQKVRNLVRQLMAEPKQRQIGAAVVKLVALAKSIGLVPAAMTHEGYTTLTHDNEAAWLGLIDRYDIDLEEKFTEEAIMWARNVLCEDIRNAQGIIDFDDQLYMPIIAGARFWKNDFLFVDEAQDVNLVQRSMLKAALRPGGRLIAVGDSCQAIYGFRGADSDSIGNIKREFGAVELPLTISYRCPKLVVAEAHRFVSHIQASETAKDGVVQQLERFYASTFTQQDGILCRNTGPLIQLAYKLISARVPCHVMGREIGQGLISLIKKMNAFSVTELSSRLQAYLDQETVKFLAKGQEDKADALADKVGTIEVFIQNMGIADTIQDLIHSIDSLFSDDADKDILTLCTVHKAKGLEWERVFILDPDLMPSRYARQDWQKDQERNLQYVAVTRSRSELYYINSDDYLDPKQQEVLTHAKAS